MISLDELLQKKFVFKDLPKETQDNLMILLERINKIRAAYGKPMTITSCLRTPADQQRINPKAPKSNHLIGAAVDISDPKGELDEWCVKNEKLLQTVGLWLEHKDDTPTWTHFQIYPPKSGNRFFHP